jgi:hypothetical protein
MMFAITFAIETARFFLHAGERSGSTRS